MIDYVLIRSDKRRTVQLSVGRDGEIILRAPVWSRRDYLDAFVERNRAWAEAARARVLEQNAARESAGGLRPAALPYLGRELPVFLTDGRARLEEDGFYLPEGSLEQLRPAIERLYRKRAAELLPPLTKKWADVMGVDFTAVKTGGAKKRWGSCGSNGSISYSWRIVTAPPEGVDYLVIHELAHRRQMNHSARFWAIVESFCPERKKMKAQLTALQHRLNELGF